MTIKDFFFKLTFVSWNVVLSKEYIAAARRAFAALERMEVARHAARDEWRERMRELEIKEHGLCWRSRLASVLGSPLQKIFTR